MTTGPGMKRTRKWYSAKQKAEAVLAVWTGRRSAGQVCREIGSHGNVLAGWEKRALSGMLEALGSRPGSKEAQPLDLGRRLENLLNRPAEVKAVAAVPEPTPEG